MSTSQYPTLLVEKGKMNTTEDLIDINVFTNTKGGHKEMLYSGLCYIKPYEEDEHHHEVVSENNDITNQSFQNNWDHQYAENAVFESINHFTSSELDSNDLTDTIVLPEDDICLDFHEIEIVDGEDNTQHLEDYDGDGRSQNKYLNHTEASQESNFIDKTKTEACEQLLSLNTDTTKLSNTIFYTGDRNSGETIQVIVVNNPDVECQIINSTATTLIDPEHKKKYKCSKCKQCFYTIPLFKIHQKNVKNRKGMKPKNLVELSCEKCGKIFHCPKKLEKHSTGHDDPLRECEICGKVLASKSILRTHRAIHRREYKCKKCPKSFSKQEDYAIHQARTHCSISTKIFKLYEDPKHYHERTKPLNQTLYQDTGNTESDIIIFKSKGFNEQSRFDSGANPKDFNEQSRFDSGANLYSEKISSDEPDVDDLCTDCTVENVDSAMFDYIENHLSNTDNSAYIENDEILNSIDVFNDTPLASFEDESQKDTDSYEMFQKELNSVIAATDNIGEAENIMKQLRTELLFFCDTKFKQMDCKKYKICKICEKKFNRLTDLKNHYIEHLVQCALAMNSTNRQGALALKCEFCVCDTFDKIRTFKAHLRQHAKLTNYECTICNKSFSNSSNFAKHRKVHNNNSFECDLCLRKFTSKKMIIKHMEAHERTKPINCLSCGQLFFFESMLKKHHKTKHSKSWYKCYFCGELFENLSRKWDHQWNIHNLRNTSSDCMFCKKQFRKYSDLKKHCLKVHEMAVPKSKSLNQEDQK